MNHAAYDQIADWYDEQIRSDSLMDRLLMPHLPELLGDVAAVSICDLGCGQGKLARWLAQQGANVTGVDQSSKLLKIAERYEATQPLGIRHYWK